MSPRPSHHKSARLLVLLQLQRRGLLGDIPRHNLAHHLGIDRTTLWRDLQTLPHLEREYNQLLAAQPWLQTHYTVAEFAAEIGAADETVRCMIRDGLIAAEKIPIHRGQGGQWRIPVQELDWWKRPK